MADVCVCRYLFWLNKSENRADACFDMRTQIECARDPAYSQTAGRGTIFTTKKNRNLFEFQKKIGQNTTGYPKKTFRPPQGALIRRSRDVG